MIYLLLNILLSSSFLLVIRWVQQRDDDVLTIGAINYIIAGAFAAVMFFGGDNSSYSTASCVTGAVNGCAYFVAFFFLLASMTWKGAAMTAVITRLSVLLPVVGGIVIWSERPSLWQSTGIALSCVSLAMIGNRAVQVEGKGAPRYAPLFIIAFFVIAGSSRLAQEAFKHEAPQVEQPAYLLTGFGLAAAASIVMMIARRKSPTLAELAIGSFVGVTNVLQTLFILKALEALDGFIVFPVTSAGGLLFTALIAVMFLKERLTWRNYAGIGIAVCSLALLHEQAVR